MSTDKEAEEAKQKHETGSDKQEDKNPGTEKKEPKKTIPTKGNLDWKEIAEDVAGKSSEALKTSAEKLGVFVKVNAEKVGEFTSHTAQLAKLKLEEHRLNSELNKQFQVVGEKLWRLYHTQKLTDVATSFSDELEKISKIEETLKQNRKDQK